MKRIVYLVLSLTFIFAIEACKKNEPFVNETPATPPTPAPVIKGDYQPTAKGSVWHYIDAAIYTLTMKNDTIISGTTWTIASSSASGNALFRKENGNYYQQAKDPQGVTFTLLYLKDTVDLGTTWNNDVIVNGVNTRYQYVMIAKGLNKLVGSTTYPNVIQIHLNVSIDAANTGVYTPYSTGEYYYARDIGFIYSNIQGSETIVSSYFIK